MKQQFVRIKPSTTSSPSPQESTSEDVRNREALTPPPEGPSLQAERKSSASYWYQEETEKASSNAIQHAQDETKQLYPGMNAPKSTTQQAPHNAARGPVPHAPSVQGHRSPAQSMPPSAPPGGNRPYTPTPVQQSSRSQYPGTTSSPYNSMTQSGAPFGQPPAPMPLNNGGYAPPPGQPPVPMWQNNAHYGPPGQPPLVRAGKPLHKKRRFPIWARVVVAVVTVLVVTSGVAFAYYQANFANPLTKITGQQAAQIGMDGKSTGQTIATGSGIGNKRINILLLGSDNDGKNAAPLAQTDIVVTVDPQTHYVGMLSIPRDMRVSIPSQGNGKMDAAFSFGWQGNYGGSTPLANAAGLSIATVEKNFGIHIDHYAWVGLDGFVKVINTAGGVDIDATHPIMDNSYPNDVNTTDHFGYKRLYVAPGPQHMNGVQALEYVRTRHADLVGDFGRSARQQQVLSQLKTKLDTSSIISKLPELANDLGDTVKTDMSLQDIVNFVSYAHDIDTNKVDRLILSPPYSTLATDNTGDYLPNCNLITPKIAQMFDLGNTATCIPTAATNAGNTAAKSSNSSTLTSALATTALTSLANASASTNLNPAVQPNNKNVTGVHSLLDLMFLAVFDSFDATKV